MRHAGFPLPCKPITRAIFVLMALLTGHVSKAPANELQTANRTRLISTNACVACDLNGVNLLDKI